jgi:putative transposase
MAIEKELLDQLLAGRDLNEVFAKDGLLDDLKKALSERILNAELDEHLDGERVEGSANRRNGHSKKSVLTGTSKMTLSIPRDRAGTFDPKLIAKYQRRFPDFDEKIISMYARGMSVREIRGHLEELYGIDLSADLISAVTDAVLEEVAEWQNRPLDVCYPLVLRRDTGQNPRRRLCPQQGHLHCAWDSPGWHQGDTRHLDRADRGRQVLAACHERAEEPRH